MSTVCPVCFANPADLNGRCHSFSEFRPEPSEPPCADAQERSLVPLRFRKKPVVIEAVQINAADFNGRDFDGFPFNSAPPWLMHALDQGRVVVADTKNHTDYAEWEIRTLEDGHDGRAKHVATPGDWIIRGVQGELYACKPDIFAATYEVADGPLEGQDGIAEAGPGMNTNNSLPKSVDPKVLSIVRAGEHPSNDTEGDD